MHPDKVVFVVDNNIDMLDSITTMIPSEEYAVYAFSSAKQLFRSSIFETKQGVLLMDLLLDGSQNGLDVFKDLRRKKCMLPTILMTENASIKMAVQSIKSGCFDFIEKPINRNNLIELIELALKYGLNNVLQSFIPIDEAKELVSSLTKREKEVLTYLTNDLSNKGIAEELGLSERTVEKHRASLMQKTGAKSLSCLIKISIASTFN